MLLEWLSRWISSSKEVIRPKLTTIAFLCSGLLILSVVLVELNHSDGSIAPRRILETVRHHAKHKDIFPLDQSDIVGTALVGIGLMVAASGGVGGGGILVPLLIIVFGFHPKNAIPLSNFTILGSSITNMILNFPKRHPDADRPLVDWDLILVMEPVTMAGAIIGALVGKVLPDWLLVISLVVLLAYTTYTTLIKAKSQYDKETLAIATARKSILLKTVDEDVEMSEKVGLLSSEGISGGDDDNLNGDAAEYGLNSPTNIADELLQLIDMEKGTPTSKVIILSIMVAVVVGLNLLKGGRGFSPLGITCGSNSYWALTGLILIWILAISFWMRAELIEKWKLKQRLNYKYLSGDIEWDEKNTLLYPSLCFFAGFFAGMFGVGGGIVKGPLMLQMGVHPLVAAGTTAVMIMFTSVAATTMFIAFGTLIWDYAWFLFVVGLIATTVGQYGVGYYVDKYKRYSFISMSIGAVVFMSTILLGLQSIFSLIEAQEEGGGGFGSICGKDQ